MKQIRWREQFDQPPWRIPSSVAWGTFWIIIFTLGEPDLLTAIIDWIGRH